jgi:hypothetical protein
MISLFLPSFTLAFDCSPHATTETILVYLVSVSTKIFEQIRSLPGEACRTTKETTGIRPLEVVLPQQLRRSDRLVSM